jgi:hypothetical protein
MPCVSARYRIMDSSLALEMPRFGIEILQAGKICFQTSLNLLHLAQSFCVTDKIIRSRSLLLTQDTAPDRCYVEICPIYTFTCYKILGTTNLCHFVTLSGSFKRCLISRIFDSSFAGFLVPSVSAIYRAHRLV